MSKHRPAQGWGMPDEHRDRTGGVAPGAGFADVMGVGVNTGQPSWDGGDFGPVNRSKPVAHHEAPGVTPVSIAGSPFVGAPTEGVKN
ncbi:hypothetical protein ACWCXC_29150 [Streptomyces sp. NPDC001515]